MKIIVASDSWKESLTAKEVGDSICGALLEYVPDVEVVNIPLADGGEGMADAIGPYCGAELIKADVHDALMRPLKASYYFDEVRKMAFMDMASASGLAFIEPSLRNPLMTTTFGTGELILDALNRGARKVVLGLGGSATSDAGFGALQALGVLFFDKKGGLIERHISGGDLELIGSIDDRMFRKKTEGVDFSIACDVDAPFLGERGAVAVFSAQKGADEEKRQRLERGMENVAGVLQRMKGERVMEFPGAGAAGGMAGGFVAFTGAETRRGISLVLDSLGFQRKIEGATMVITGEGKADRQTLMWKTPYGVLSAAQSQGIPVILLAGKVEDVEKLKEAGFREVIDINRFAESHGDNPEANPLDPSVATRRLRLAIKSLWE